jgi:hypothetical protein
MSVVPQTFRQAASTLEVAVGILLLAAVSVLVIIQLTESDTLLRILVTAFHFATVGFVGLELKAGNGVVPLIATGTIGSGITATLLQTAIVGGDPDDALAIALLVLQSFANALQLGIIIADLRKTAGYSTVDDGFS